MLYSDIVKKKAFLLSSWQTGISQPIAWLFHCKLQQAFASRGNNPLTGQVHIDKFVTGGPDNGKLGRSDGTKKKPLIWWK